VAQVHHRPAAFGAAVLLSLVPLHHPLVQLPTLQLQAWQVSVARPLQLAEEWQLQVKVLVQRPQQWIRPLASQRKPKHCRRRRRCQAQQPCAATSPRASRRGKGAGQQKKLKLELRLAEAQPACAHHSRHRRWWLLLVMVEAPFGVTMQTAVVRSVSE